MEHSQLDYCNGVLAGITQQQLSRLQSVLRASAHLVLCLPSRQSVSSMIQSTLHWLPYPQRITYKLCTTVYKCQHDLSPRYLSTMSTRLSDVSSRASLRSAAQGQLLVPATRTKTFGPRGFFYSG